MAVSREIDLAVELFSGPGDIITRKKMGWARVYCDGMPLAFLPDGGGF